MDDAPTAWTTEELRQLRELEAQALSPEAIALRLGRPLGEVVPQLISVLHAGEERLAGGAEPSFGGDEEGDVIPSRRGDADPAAWVHGG